MIQPLFPYLRFSASYILRPFVQHTLLPSFPFPSLSCPLHQTQTTPHASSPLLLLIILLSPAFLPTTSPTRPRWSPVRHATNPPLLPLENKILTRPGLLGGWVFACVWLCFFLSHLSRHGAVFSPLFIVLLGKAERWSGDSRVIEWWHKRGSDGGNSFVFTYLYIYICCVFMCLCVYIYV